MLIFIVDFFLYKRIILYFVIMDIISIIIINIIIEAATFISFFFNS